MSRLDGISEWQVGSASEFESLVLSVVPGAREGRRRRVLLPGAQGCAAVSRVGAPCRQETCGCRLCGCVLERLGSWPSGTDSLETGRGWPAAGFGQRTPGWRAVGLRPEHFQGCQRDMEHSGRVFLVLFLRTSLWQPSISRS